MHTAIISTTPSKPAIKTPHMDLMTGTPNTPQLTDEIPMATTPEAKRLEFYTDTPSFLSCFDIACNHYGYKDLNLCETPRTTPRHLSNHMTTNAGMGNEVGSNGNNTSHEERDYEVSLKTLLVH
jgi:hypothetical protein